MLDFKVNKKTCISCGACAADCPANIIVMEKGWPLIAPETEDRCYRCQHCLAVCPSGAISILGVDPVKSIPLKSAYPSEGQMNALIKGRRSVRHYKDENVDPALIRRLLETAWHAPTGKNARGVLLTVIDTKEALSRFRSEVLEGLGRLVDSGKMPPGKERFTDIYKAWAEKKVDILFRGAPHLLVTSAPAGCITPETDGIIALSYFELLAQSQGLGTVWDGLLKWAMELVPESRDKLKIPPDHIVCYAMVFGKPAVKFARTVQHAPAKINRI